MVGPANDIIGEVPSREKSPSEVIINFDIKVKLIVVQ